MFKRWRFYWAALIFLLCSVTGAAHAVLIETTGARYESGGVRYYFTVTSWEEGGGSFCADMSAANCTLGIYGLQKPNYYAGMVPSTHRWRITPTTSMESVLSQMGVTIPFEGSVLVPKNKAISDSFCISFTQGYSYVGSGGIITPVGPCAAVKKPALQCAIEGNTRISHGNISDANVDGEEAAVTLQLTCSGASSVTASVSNASGVKLRADGSLYSKITIEDKDPAAGVGVPIQVQQGVPTPISVKSTLFTNGTVEPGYFYGSTVLTISPP